MLKKKTMYKLAKDKQLYCDYLVSQYEHIFDEELRMIFGVDSSKLMNIAISTINEFPDEFKN